MMKKDLSAFGTLLLFVVGGIIFLSLLFFISKLLRQSKPNSEKLSPYESGEEPTGNAYNRFNVKYFTIALIFLIFEVEIIFLFPWATIFTEPSLMAETNNQWGWFALTEVLVFIFILGIGLVYVWSQGLLDWVKTTSTSSNFKSPIPPKLYQDFNLKQN